MECVGWRGIIMQIKDVSCGETLVEIGFLNNKKKLEQ